MDALIVFGCIFVPTFLLNLLSAGRDQLLFEVRPRAGRWAIILAMLLGLALLTYLGLPPSWTVALVVAGPLGALAGNWIGSGDWIVAHYRIRRLLGRDRPGQ